jgi:hypothetical protein
MSLMAALRSRIVLPVPKRIHEAVPANLAGGAGLSTKDAARERQVTDEAGTPLRSVAARQLAADRLRAARFLRSAP